MKLKISKKVQTILKIVFVSIVCIFVIREFGHILKGVNLEYFIRYQDKLTFINLVIIAVVGLLAFAPMSCYDFILKKKVGINLPYKSVYKYSFIASSIASIMGFGGAASLAIKQHFYGDYVKDKKLLLKEVSKIIGLNLTGLSIVCLFYIASDFIGFSRLGWFMIPIALIGIYCIGVMVFLLYKLIKEKDVSDFLGTLAIMGMSTLEWLGALLLLYIVLRITGGRISFYHFLPIYITSSVIGILSLIPGGAGTFDLAFIAGVQGFGISVAQALIVVILYRISYYIIPVIIGISLYLRDFSKRINERYNNLPSQFASTFAYKFLRILVFLTGIVMLLTGINENLLEKIRIFGKLFGYNTLGFSNDLSILIGFLSIVAACLLRYRSKTIYKSTLVLIVFGIIILLSKGFYPGEIVISAFAAYILYRSKDSFYRESFVVGWKNTIKDAFILMCSLLGYYAILEIYVKYTRDPLARRLFRHLGTTALYMFIIAVIVYIIIYFINNESKLPYKTFYDCEDDINNIVHSYRGSSLTHLVYLRDKYIYINKEKDVMLQYQIYSDKIFVLGNPIGNNENIYEAIESFYEFADKYGHTVVFYQIEENMIKYLHSHGYDFMKIGEEAMIDVQSFEVVGNKMKSLKKSRNKMISEGYTFEMIYPPYSKEIIQTLKHVSDDWLDGRAEKGYSVGFFDEYYLSKEAIGVVKDENGEIKGFANLMDMYNGDESFSVDLMRFTKDSARGVMDFMFINLIEDGKEKGFKKFNMGMAPLANVGTSKYAFFSEKVALGVYEYGQIFYSFKGLRKFKNKYTNNWEPRYIAYRRGVSIIFIMIQSALLVKNSGNNTESAISRIRKEIF
ncbi:MAG: bifunctional lysylphosphatidylglycerol flippase/synthetase MprF [Sarcina sp.]